MVLFDDKKILCKIVYNIIFYTKKNIVGVH